MEITIHQIEQILKRLPDPVSILNLFEANRVEGIKVDGQEVAFTLNLPAIDAITKSNINFACMKAVNEVFPEAQVHVHINTQGPTGTDKPKVLPQVKNIIAVASGKGGVGKSTVASNLALGLKKLGLKVGLIDADLYGPSIPTMFGLQGERPSVRDIYGKPKIIPLEAFGIPVMSIGFIVEPQQAVVLRGPRLGGIIKQFIEDCVWPELDFLLIDLPPGTGDIQLTLVQTVPITGAVMVTTPQDVAVADAIKAMNMFLMPNVNVPILGVVENMSWFTPAELPENKYYIFGEGGGKEMAKLSNSVLLGQVPLVQGVREGGDKGRPIVLKEEAPIGQAFMNIAENTLRQIAIRNEVLGPTRPVEIKNS